MRYINDADRFLKGRDEKNVKRTCGNCMQYKQSERACRDHRLGDFSGFYDPEQKGCWCHRTEADRLAIIAECERIMQEPIKKEVINAAAKIEELEKSNAELLDALENLLSECERVDYKLTPPSRFLNYDPAVIAKAFKAVKKARGGGDA